MNALPRRRRHGLRRAPAAGRRPGPRGRDDRRRPRPAALSARAVPRRTARWSGARARARRCDRDILRPVDDPFDAEGGIRLLTGGLGRAVIKTSAVKPEHHRDRGAGDRVRRPGRPAGRLQARRARPRLRRRRPLPGPAGQRHAGAAQPDPDAGRAAGPRPQGGAGHRRAHVRRLGQGAGGDPRDAGGRRRRRRWPSCATATSSGSTPRPACWRSRSIRRACARARRRPRRRPSTASGASSSATCAAAVGPAEAGASVLF